jgi:hypothetical protein
MNLNFIDPAIQTIDRFIRESLRSSRTICLAIILAILIVGLWPLNFFPKNKVAWLPDQKGVHFYGQGAIIGSGVFDQARKLPLDGSITLALRLRPLEVPTNSPHILTLYDGKLPELLMIGQWRSHLIIRSRTDDPASRKRDKAYQEIGLRNALIANQDTVIMITSGPAGSAIYANGKPARTYPRHRLLAQNRQGNAHLLLGNSVTGDSDWNGILTGLAIYNRALSPEQVSSDYQSWLRNDYSNIKQDDGLLCLYSFSERKGTIIHNEADANDTLTIPQTFQPIRRHILSTLRPDVQWNLSFVQDVTINILGFIPFGFYFSALMLKTARRKRLTAYVIVALLGMGMSLSIELTQAYLPTRDSSLIDFLMNSLGAILGIVLFNCKIFRL